MSRPGELESATEPTHVAGKRKLEVSSSTFRLRIILGVPLTKMSLVTGASL